MTKNIPFQFKFKSVASKRLLSVKPLTTNCQHNFDISVHAASENLDFHNIRTEETMAFLRSPAIGKYLIGVVHLRTFQYAIVGLEHRKIISLTTHR